MVLTAGADIQVDRLEIEIVSWSALEESWNIDYQIFEGDPAQKAVWDEFGKFILETRYTHATGKRLPIAALCLDSGYLAAQAVNFIKGLKHEHAYATKGVSELSRPLIEGRETRALRLRKRSKHGYKPELIGVDEGKTILYNRLMLTEPGAGYCHFPKERDAEYFDQLTAEKCVKRKRRGFTVREWIAKRTRNEAIDNRVLAHAALRLLDPDWKALEARINAAPKKPNPERQIKKRPRNQRRGGFVTNW